MNTATTPAAQLINASVFTTETAMDSIQHFITFFPPDDVEEHLWQLLIGSMGSPHADDWTGEERSNLLLFCRLTAAMAGAVHFLHAGEKGIANHKQQKSEKTG